jgi:hypothetical protein
MRRDRSGRQWSASAAGAALLFILSGSAVTLSASPDPSASPEPTSSESAAPSASPTDAPSPTPSPTASPTASAAIQCDEPLAEVDGDDTLVRGDTVRVRFSGFTPNVNVRLDFRELTGDVNRTIGTAPADGAGNGVVEGVVPTDAPVDEAELRVIGDDGCLAYLYFWVLGSPDTISIDDDTVMPGQRVTVTAGGFLPNGDALLSIDNAPTQGECIPRCLYLAMSQTNGVGSVVFRARIPRHISAGRHVLWVTGGHLNGISDAYQSIEITVGAGSTMPPTDTVSAG